MRKRLLSLGMIMGIGFLLVVSLVVSAGLAALARWWGPLFGDFRVLACVLDFSLSFAIVTGAFAMIYKWMPRLRLDWRAVWTGAAGTAAVHNRQDALIGTYLGRSGISSVFGAASSLVMVVWVYYLAQVCLLGVEFTRLYATHYGSLRRRSESGPY